MEHIKVTIEEVLYLAMLKCLDDADVAYQNDNREEYEEIMDKYYHIAEVYDDL